MKKSKLKKLCSVLLAATLACSVLTGCGSSNGSAGESGQVLTYNLAEDPKTLDPALNTSMNSGTVLVNAFEGLCKLDEKSKPVAGVAESWDISEDQTVYTFHLRDSKWSNGDPVKAGDFEYAWKRVLNPEMASEYAYQMSYIKGADEYNEGKGTADEVGVKALDDKTLQVTLKQPCSYFLDLTAFPCYFPVNEAVVTANKDWALSAENYVSNGPFKMTDYRIKDEIVLAKNENYYDAGSIKLDKLDMKLVTEDTSAWASYQSGQFDMVDTVPTSEVQGALQNGQATSFDNLGNGFFVINVSDKVDDPEVAKALGNKKVRQALNLSLDRKSICENILKAGQTPAHGFVPTGIEQPDGTDFATKKYFDGETSNVDEAKKLLAEAGYPDGEGFPNVVLLYNPEGGNGDLAQALQDMWKSTLGINITLQSQEWKVFQTTRQSKQYQIARHGWSGDYVDPMTFLDMWETGAGTNDAGYSNPEYDKVVEAAKAETDSTKRFELLHQAEDMLMDDMPIIPLYYYVKVKGVKSYVKDVNVSPLGYIYFDKTYIDGK